MHTWQLRPCPYCQCTNRSAETCEGVEGARGGEERPSAKFSRNPAATSLSEPVLHNHKGDVWLKNHCS